MPGYEVWEYHGEVVPNRNVEEEENNDWVGDDAMHEMLNSLRPELNLSFEDFAIREVSRFLNY
jgi:SET domain-containing protein